MGDEDLERYLTEDLPGIGGVIKERVEDFLVEELPLYAPSGEGEHTFFEIRKVGISTFQAVRTIAQALGVPPNAIGYAGLKDAQAITCQVLSVHNVPPEAVTALDLPKLRVMWAERHRNKLKVGHLRGNRFTIRVREVDETVLPACQSVLDVLAQRVGLIPVRAMLCRMRGYDLTQDTGKMPSSCCPTAWPTSARPCKH
jgi:tRNA pseudouridine13 synthase